MKTVNIAPTWRDAVTFYLRLMSEHPPRGDKLAREVWENAWEEILRAADLADRYVKEKETKPKKRTTRARASKAGKR